MIYTTIGKNLITAMKSKDAVTTKTLRMLKSALGNIAIDKKVKIEDLSDSEVIVIIRKEIKKCQDSYEGFKLDNREESMAEELNSVLILSEYLPKELTSEELEVIIKDSINEVNATSKKQMGQVMKVAIIKAEGRISSQVLSGKIAQLLN